MSPSTPPAGHARSSWLTAALLALAAVPVALGQGTSSAATANAPAATGSFPVDFGTPSFERLPRGMIFFPPFPPPLDYAINRSIPTPGGPGGAPAELAEYAADIFYPQLSNHMVERSLGEKQRQKLADYDALKLSLLKELRDALAASADAEVPARAQSLAALARKQAPQFAELEKTAEQLRNDLIAPERNWSDFREWKLADNDRRGFSPIEIAQVMRAYVHYQKGLLPGQRRLLREIVMDLAMATEATTKAATPQIYIFFSPSPARISMPDDLPPEVAAKFAAYQTKKALLKKELYDTIFAYDGKMTFLSNPIRVLADKQAKRLAELDTQAEEIRVALGPDYEILQPTIRTTLPTFLVARAAELVQRRANLQRDATARINVIAGRLRATRMPIALTYRFDNDGLHYTVQPGSARGGGGRGGRGRGGGGGGGGAPISRGGATPEVAEEIEKIREQVSEIATDYGKALADLVNDRDVLRRDIGQTLGTTDQPTIDRALANAMRAATLKADEGAYREYRIATLMPGLSPDQRILLFDAATVALALPLPRGEMQPFRRSQTW